MQIHGSYLAGLMVSCNETHKPQVYKGKDEILLSELILNPSHSILTQSFDSRLRLVRSRRLRYTLASTHA